MAGARSSRAWWPVALLLTTACGKARHSGPAVEPRAAAVDLDGEPTRGGSRLLAQRWVSDAGLEIETRVFTDTERDEDCRFLRAADGVWRCMPISNNDDLGEIYADDACTRRAAEVIADVPPTPYAAFDRCHWGTLGPFRSDERQRATYRLDATPLEQAYSGAMCESGVVSDDFDYYRVNERVRDGAFVGASEAALAGPGLVGAYQLVAEDGTVLQVSPYSRDDDRDCIPLDFGDALRCVPAPVLFTGQWPGDLTTESGRACWDLVYVANPCLEHVHYAAYVGADGELRVGEVVSADSRAWSGDEQECLGRARANADRLPFADGRIMILSDEVDREQFPELEWRTYERGRLSMQVLAGVDGEPIRTIYFPGAVSDSDWGDCAPREAVDGTTRCLPRPSNVSAYADDACEEALHSLATDAEPPPWLGVEVEGSGAVSVHTWGEAHEGPIFGLQASGDCVAAERVADRAYYRVGAELSPDEFVKFEFVEE